MATRRYVRIAAIGFVAILLLLLIPNTPLHQRAKAVQGWYKPAIGLNTTIFNKEKWFFEAELPEEWYPPPTFNIEKLKSYAPHNWKGPGHPTFATVFTSRDSGHQDPYFLAIQQVAYRLLWDPRSKSKYPYTVFVAPFIPQDQRDILSAAGANVVEIELVPYEPPVTGLLIAGRLRDMFSKLQMWAQTQFSLIAYLDSDAFPIAPADAIFEDAEHQRCKKELVGLEDQEQLPAVCEYVMSAYMEMGDSMNAGVMVLKPDMPMYNRLIRETKNSSNFDSGMMEQALLSYAFNPHGAFPPHNLPKHWNGSPDSPSRGETVYILHAKLWAMFWSTEADAWCSDMFNQTWKAMNRLYNDPAFETMRAEDGVQGVGLASTAS